MKKNIILFVLIIIAINFSLAQKKKSVSSVSSSGQSENLVFLDFGILPLSDAKTIGFGVNYERLLSEHFSIRGGVNTSNLKVTIKSKEYDAKAISFPISLNHLTSGEGKFEIGAGAGPVIMDGYLQFWGTFSIGYRYQPKNSGLMYRIGFGIPSNFYPSIISIGYCF